MDMLTRQTYSVFQGSFAFCQAQAHLRDESAHILNSVLMLTAQGPDPFRSHLEVIQAGLVVALLAPRLGQLEAKGSHRPCTRGGKQDGRRVTELTRKAEE